MLACASLQPARRKPRQEYFEEVSLCVCTETIFSVFFFFFPKGVREIQQMVKISLKALYKDKDIDTSQHGKMQATWLQGLIFCLLRFWRQDLIA